MMKNNIDNYQNLNNYHKNIEKYTKFYIIKSQIHIKVKKLY